MPENRELERLRKDAKAYEASYKGAGSAPQPSRRILVLTCMDARLQPDQVLGLGFGETHILRNAGGRVSDDMVRSIAVSTNLLGTRHILVIQHTKCGMAAASQDEIAATIRENTGGDPSGVDFLAIGDQEADLAGDVDRLLTCGLLPEGTDVSGWIADVDTGGLSLKVPPRTVG